MARYRIREDESAVTVELTEVGGEQERLLAAFGECQAGECSCPTDEYGKLASMKIEQADGVVRLRLETRPGEKLAISEIAACLDHTTALVAGSKSES